MGACSFLAKAETLVLAMPYNLLTYGCLNKSSIKLNVSVVLVPLLDTKDISGTEPAGSGTNLYNRCDYLCIDII
jgi:hypothetical protein